MRTRLTAASFGLAMAAAIYLLVGPVYAGSNGGRPTQATLLQVNGPWAIIPVMFPVLIALTPLVFRKQAVRIAAAIVMGGFALISGFSIGLFYFPAAILMLLAPCVEPSAKFRDVWS
jgi:hypothetical protein